MYTRDVPVSLSHFPRGKHLCILNNCIFVVRIHSKSCFNLLFEVVDDYDITLDKHESFYLTFSVNVSIIFWIHPNTHTETNHFDIAPCTDTDIDFAAHS